MDLATAVEMGQSGGLFAFAWLVWQEVRALRKVLNSQARLLALLEERTRDCESA